jgi:hypothetical protein
MTYSHAALARAAEAFGPAYLTDLEPAAVARDDQGVTYDTTHPAWLAAKVKYAKSKGLGDTLKKLTTAIGIKPCAGCQKRAEILNRVFPYKKS